MLEDYSQQGNDEADGALAATRQQSTRHCVKRSPVQDNVAVRLTAEQAERAGLAARVVPAAELMAEARALAGRIASAPAPAVAKAKDCVLRAMEVPLAEGLRYEQCAPAWAASPS